MDILYSDRQIAVCVKPVGLNSEAGENSLPNLLTQTLGGTVYPIHRLDLNVGGAMVYARTKQAAAFLSRAAAEKCLQKEYRAVVHGAPPESGVLQDLLWKDSGRNKVYVVKRERRGVKKAELHYRVLSRREDRALLEIHLHTGRSHQIRVQFASRGFPLFGDGKYGARDDLPAPALWSYCLTFPHPNGTEMTFSRPPQGEIWQLCN